MLQFGIDKLLASPPRWQNQRIGLVTNHAATTHQLIPSRVALLQKGFNITRLFSPEHGLDVNSADGHAVKDGKDLLTGLPVTSLYNTQLAPGKEQLAETDIVLFDIPDIGSRFYTYVWTMTHVMEACARENKPLVILDRPNPVSGRMELVEGPVLDATQSSFIGRWPIPVRHSCTLGELALYFNEIRKVQCRLEVINCGGWTREQFQPDWGISFVPTSPAIQNFESMVLYPGLCLLEATNISEGRGTPYSFRAAAAPWIRGERVAEVLNEMGLNEVNVIPVQFTNKDPYAKYAGEPCYGVHFEVKEPHYFQAVSFGLILIRLIRQFYPAHFSWKPYPTLVNPTGQQHLDKLLGIPDSEALFELSLPKFMAGIARLTQCKDWKKEMEPYLLY